MHLIGSITIIVISILIIANPAKFTTKKIAKIEAENGTPLTTEEIDKKNKNAKITGIVFLVIGILFLISIFL